MPLAVSFSSSIYLRLLLALLAVVMVALSAHAQNTAQIPDAHIDTIRAILEQPDNQIDLAKAKLTIDRLIDPSIDIQSNLKRLDAIAKQVTAMLPANASSLQKMETLIQYLYKAGPWNDNQPYRYDLDDPFGHNIRNKLIPTYLTTRKGNCVSMPSLFVIIGKKLGLDVTISTTPEHLFVKYRLDEDQFRNFEATSGGPKLDSSYRRDMPMTNEALANGVYMRPLNKKETVVVLAGTLSEFYKQQGQPERRIALADLLLKYSPKDVATMLQKSAGYNGLVKRDFMAKYPTPNDIPFQERAYFSELERNYDLWVSKAQALGWREPDETTDTNYKLVVERARAKALQ